MSPDPRTGIDGRAVWSSMSPEERQAKLDADERKYGYGKYAPSNSNANAADDSSGYGNSQSPSSYDQQGAGGNGDAYGGTGGAGDGSNDAYASSRPQARPYKKITSKALSKWKPADLERVHKAMALAKATGQCMRPDVYKNSVDVPRWFLEKLYTAGSGNERAMAMGNVNCCPRETTWTVSDAAGDRVDCCTGPVPKTREAARAAHQKGCYRGGSKPVAPKRGCGTKKPSKPSGSKPWGSKSWGSKPYGSKPSKSYGSKPYGKKSYSMYKPGYGAGPVDSNSGNDAYGQDNNSYSKPYGQASAWNSEDSGNPVGDNGAYPQQQAGGRYSYEQLDEGPNVGEADDAGVVPYVYAADADEGLEACPADAEADGVFAIAGEDLFADAPLGLELAAVPAAEHLL